MAAIVNPELTKICDKCYELPVEPNEPAVATTYQVKRKYFFVDLLIMGPLYHSWSYL